MKALWVLRLRWGGADGTTFSLLRSLKLGCKRQVALLRKTKFSSSQPTLVFRVGVIVAARALHLAKPKIKLYYSPKRYVRDEIGYLGANGGVCYSTITFRVPKEYDFTRLYEPTHDVALLRSRWYCARKTV